MSYLGLVLMELVQPLMSTNGMLSPAQSRKVSGGMFWRKIRVGIRTTEDYILHPYPGPYPGHSPWTYSGLCQQNTGMDVRRGPLGVMVWQSKYIEKFFYLSAAVCPLPIP